MLNDALHGPACMLIKANVRVCVCGFLPDLEICGHLRMSMRIDASYTHVSVLRETSSAENMADTTAPWTGKTQDCIDLARKHGPLMALHQ